MEPFVNGVGEMDLAGVVRVSPLVFHACRDLDVESGREAFRGLEAVEAFTPGATNLLEQPMTLRWNPTIGEPR